MDNSRVDLWHPINGEWHHIVQVVEGERTEYYTDGKLIDISSQFDGVVGDVRIHTSALTVEEIVLMTRLAGA